MRQAKRNAFDFGHREFPFVQQNVIVARSSRANDGRVWIEVKISISRVHYNAVNASAGQGIAISITSPTGEKDGVVALLHVDKRDGGHIIQLSREKSGHQGILAREYAHNFTYKHAQAHRGSRQHTSSVKLKNWDRNKEKRETKRKKRKEQENHDE
jgi:hypothetical protein